MAKKWTPSQKQLQLYDELLKRQNITRKRLLRRRRIIEERGGFGRPLPDLVIPMKAKRHRDLSRYTPRFDSYADYRNKIRALQQLYGGKGSPDLNYYKVNYKRNILDHIKDWISAYINFTAKPEGNFGRYSAEQIEIANKLTTDGDGGKYLDLYNKMISLSIGEFMIMYDSGMIPSLRHVYDEIRNVSSISFSYIDEFIQSYNDYKRQAREQDNTMVKDIQGRDLHQRKKYWSEYADYYIKQSKKEIKKATEGDY